MDDLTTLALWLHLLGVATWLGGMLFLGLVVIPVVRASGGVQASRALVTAVARRFGIVGGAAWALIFLTGFWLLAERDISPSELPDTEYGQRILTKLILLLVIGVAVLVHGLVQGPRVRRAEAAGDEPARRRWAAIGGVLDAGMLLLTLVALWLGASLGA